MQRECRSFFMALIWQLPINLCGASSERRAAPTLASRYDGRLGAHLIRSHPEGIAAITSDPAQAEVSWEIVVGALAGVAPFVVAGVEFSKRIVEQRNCKVCKGSGLVLRDNKYYFRCPRCGGFLPWQSWKRFFTG